MRSKKAILNTLTGLLYEVTAVICGFILPRMILSAFGSEYNGVTSSITQFLGYVALLRAGIGGVSKAALYGPLAAAKTEEISGIINATEAFLRRVALIFAASLFIFAAGYPFFVRDDFEWLFTFTLVLIIGASTFVQYFFGMTYQILLQADQRQCVISLVQIATTILNTFVAAVLIRFGASIHIVKIGSAVVFSLNPLVIHLYARRTYRIDKHVAPNREAIRDRWDCFGLQVANFVNSNTDMLILTVFTNVREVSVYSVYYLVTNGVRKILLTFVNGIGAAFGNMFARKEMAAIQRNLLLYEQITFSVSNFLFCVTISRILPFVYVYTKGVTDAEYMRPVFAYVLVIATLFSAYRIPYQSIVEAVGHFKQTRNGAFLEALLNIAMSIVMVQRYGLVGVAIGTLCAAIFRTLQYGTYMSKHILSRSLWPLLKRLALSAATVSVVVYTIDKIGFSLPETYGEWFLQTLAAAGVAFAVVVGIELVFYREDLQLTLKKVTGALRRKKGNEFADV